MKVIDLLNKIANGEEVKFKILDNDEIKDEIFEIENESLRNRTCGKWIEVKVSIDTWESISSYFLNKEVEIIEEDKKDNFTGTKYYQDGREIYRIYSQPPFKCRDDVEVEEDKKIEKLSFGDVSGTPKRANENDIIDKINEIIDYINKEK